jgi:hypothetical protein
MSILKSFAPFIAYSLVANWFDWRIAIAFGLVALIAVIYTSPSHRMGVLGAAQLGFLVVAGMFAIARPDSGLQQDLNAIGMAWIAVASAVSILVGRPFTLDYSTDGVAPEIVASKLFMQINRTIAWVWTACFAACAAVGFAAAATNASNGGTIVSAVLLLGAIIFTNAYPDRAVVSATAGSVQDSELSSIG